MSIRIGILGYGNLGRGVECAVREHEDMELVAVFCRMARIIRSGAKASARVTVMPSAASRASRMPSSTRSQLRVLLRLCAPARIRNSRRVRSTRANALWSSKRVPMQLMWKTPSRRCRTTLMSTTRRYISSVRKSSRRITAALHTAAAAVEQAGGWAVRY